MAYRKIQEQDQQANGQKTTGAHLGVQQGQWGYGHRGVQWPPRVCAPGGQWWHRWHVLERGWGCWHASSSGCAPREGAVRRPAGACHMLCAGPMVGGRSRSAQVAAHRMPTTEASCFCYLALVLQYTTTPSPACPSMLASRWRSCGGRTTRWGRVQQHGCRVWGGGGRGDHGGWGGEVVGRATCVWGGPTRWEAGLGWMGGCGWVGGWQMGEFLWLYDAACGLGRPGRWPGEGGSVFCPSAGTALSACVSRQQCCRLRLPATAFPIKPAGQPGLHGLRDWAPC